MIKKVLIFFVLLSLCVYALAGCQQPPRDYSNEVNEEPTRGHNGESTQQQPPRDYPDDNGDDNENTKP